MCTSSVMCLEKNSMKTTLLLVFLCLLAVSSHRTFHKSERRLNVGHNHCRNSYGRNRNSTGLTSDGLPCPIENGCIKLPLKRHLITRAEFEATMTGVKYSLPWRIDHLGFGPFYRQECLFYVQGNTVIVDFRARFNDSECVYLTNTTVGYFISDTHVALFNPATDYPDLPGIQMPVHYFMSDNPAEYQLLLTCVERSSIRNGYCEGRYYVDINLVQDPPNNPPFNQIEKELCRKLGLRMDDPLNRFIYKGEGCPPP